MICGIENFTIPENKHICLCTVLMISLAMLKNRGQYLYISNLFQILGFNAYIMLLYYNSVRVVQLVMNRAPNSINYCLLFHQLRIFCNLNTGFT